MGTAVLRSHDCVKSRFPTDAFRSPYPPMSPRNSSPNSARTSRRKRRYKENAENGRTVMKLPATNLVMGKVTILKRGETLKPSSPSKNSHPSSIGGSAPTSDDKKPMVAVNEDFVISSTDRLGPEPDLVPKQIRIADGVYAGSAFFSSPSPSSLPLPAFFTKMYTSPLRNVSNDAATEDLRRLLRIDQLRR